MVALARPPRQAYPGAARAALDRVGLDLAAALRTRAEARRHGLPFSSDFGRDLRVARLLDDLARDAAKLSPRVALLHEALFASATLAQTYARHRARLLDRVGADYRPVDADDLVRWLVRQVIQAARSDREPGSAVRPPALRFALDLTAGFAVVAPLTAIWQARVGVGQWRDKAFAASHAPVQADVLALLPGTAERGSPVRTADLAFLPAAGRNPCRVAVRAGQGFPPVGGTLAVVPRGEGCGVPLVPSAIGDPALSFTLAAASLALGLACATLWSALHRRYGCA